MFHRRRQEPVSRDGRARASGQDPRVNQIYSYHSSRSTRPEEKTRDIANDQTDTVAKRNQALKPKRFKATLFMVAVLAIVLLSLHLNTTHVKVVVIGDPRTKVFLNSPSTYQEAADKDFSGFLDSNKLTVDTPRIEAVLRTQFPELQAVSVALPFLGDQPTIYLQPATPQLLLVSSNKNEYLLDSTGRVVASGLQASAAGSDLQLPTVTDQSGLPVRLGQIVLPESAVAFISQVFGQMQAKGLHIASLTLPPQSPELFLHLSGLGYYVKFDLQGDAREESGSYLAVKSYLESKHIAPSQYVDVRVAGKVYYK